MPGLVGEAVTSDRIGTGVGRVDELLDGGLRRGESLLVSGAPFSGKRHLLARAACDAPRGVEVVWVSAAGPPEDGVAERARVVDAYGRAAGVRTTPGHVPVGPTLEDCVAALEGLLADGPPRPVLILVDSLSVLASSVSRERFIASFRRLVGLVRVHGAAGVFALEPEVHTAPDLTVLARLTGGVLRLAAEHDGHVLSLERPDRPRSPWTEYVFGEGRFDVTGSFHATRIR